MQGFFAGALACHPCSPERPWHLLVAWGECIPGDMLYPSNSSRFSRGARLRSGPEHCLVCAHVRSSQLHQRGGWRTVGHAGRVPEVPFDIALGNEHCMGQRWSSEGESAAIVASLHRRLSGGGGLRAALQWNGASGAHYDVYQNAISLGGASAFDVVASVPDTLASGPDDGGSDYVEITCSQPRRFCA